MFPGADSWFRESSVYDSEAMATVDTNQERKRIFGSKLNFTARTENKITSEKYKLNRLLPVSSVGEAANHGNRKFTIDTANNKIIFKLSRNNHIDLYLPKLRKNYADILAQLELICLNKSAPITYKINTTHVFITYDETKLVKQNKLIKSRFASIDLNPNYIGMVIYDGTKLIAKKLYNLTDVTNKSGLATTHTKSKYKTNKLHHELHEITCDIVRLCTSHQVNLLTLEKLQIKNKNQNKGTNFNRLVNNKWNRVRVINSLKKHCALTGITCREIFAAYSSTIGNIIYHDLPDPLATASEMAFRGYEIVITKKRSFKQFYQSVPLPSSEVLANRWKEEQVRSWVYTNWKELHELIKNAKVKYRVPIPKIGFKTFKSKSSNICVLNDITDLDKSGTLLVTIYSNRIVSCRQTFG